ncbi:MAG: hypothetical protein IKK09_06585 [Clostridia bacterium]|nr:hypothetical protein [Clostridia bacterium]
MFSEKQLEQYRSVKASQELRESVMSLEKSGKIYAFNRKTLSAIAACLVAVIALGSYFGMSAGVNAELVAVPQSASFYRATADERAVVKLDIGGSYTVKVSSGYVLQNGEQVKTAELDGETEIEWFVPAEGELVLTVKKGLIIKHYRLYHDVQGWKLEEI